jgi:heptosyltransferase-2
MAGGDPSQILVIRLGSIGDVLLATPLVRALRRAYPGALLRFLVKAPYAALLERNPHVDQVLRWPARAPRSPRSAPLWSLAVRDLVRGVPARRPLWVVDLQASQRSLAFGLALGPDRLFRYRKGYVRRALLVHLRIDRYPRPISSVAERYFEAVRELGLAPDGQGLELVVGDEPTLRATAWLEEEAAAVSRSGVERPRGWLAVAPGASWATKRWPPEGFAAAARTLAGRRGWGVALVGSVADRAATGTTGTLLRDAGIPSVDLAGRLSLLESGAVVGRSRLLLTNDSGLMHMAAALRVPVVAVFGSTTPELGFGPYQAPARVLGVDGLACRPCTHVGRRACPLGHFRCMRELDPARVVRAAEELLGSGPTVRVEARAP